MEVGNKINKNIKVIGFDPGQKKIGWAVVEKSSYLNVIETGKIVTSNSEQKASKNIFNLIERFEPDVVAYEETGSFLRGIYAKIITQATSIYKVPVIALKVNNIRDFLYLNPNISKEETHYILKTKLFNLKSEISKDELDAISVAYVALNMPIVKRN